MFCLKLLKKKKKCRLIYHARKDDDRFWEKLVQRHVHANIFFETFADENGVVPGLDLQEKKEEEVFGEQ